MSQKKSKGRPTRPKRVGGRRPKSTNGGRVPLHKKGKHKLSQQELLYPRESGPRKWFIPIVESAYTELVSRDEPKPIAQPPTAARSKATFRSRWQPGHGEDVLAKGNRNFWLDRIREYRDRAAGAALGHAAARRALFRPGPVIAGEKNWNPLGPSVVLNGQAVGNPAVGGRISGIAIAPGGQLVYAASANGGVFRSDDGGQSWRSLMDAFDVDPTNFAATSLACGAIAIDSNNPNRIYVGTGEGDTDQMFRRGIRVVDALPAYRGIGAIRSDDGGATWIPESTAVGSSDLAGKAFFALAVDPTNPENVIAATTEGLYQRV